MKKKSFVRGVSSVVMGALVLGMFSGPALPVKADTEAPQAESLLFTEYVEGSSYNKALELYNGTGGELDLSQFTIESYPNTDTTPIATLELQGTLAAGEVFVIANQRASETVLSVADMQTGSQTVNFNGNDAIVLKKGGEVIDSIGQVGSGTDFAKDVTLTRQTDQLSGDKNPNDSFDVNTPFNVYNQDQFSYLGQYPDETSPDEPLTLTTILEAKNSSEGTNVKVQGIATAMFEAGGQTNVYIQDDTAGIIVRASGLNINVGDEVTAQGNLTSYYGMEQIQTKASSVSVVKENAGVPQPETVISTDFNSENGEAIEGEFVEVNDIEIVDTNQYGDYIAKDGNGRFLITPEDDLNIEVGKTYELLQGVVNYSFNEYRLVPREQSDIVEKIFSVYATPAPGNVVEGTEVTLGTAQPDASIHYTTGGSEPTSESTTYTSPIMLEEDTTIKAVVVKEGGETSEVGTFTYEVLKAEDSLNIHDIQGASHESPYKGINVRGVDGIVTALDGTSGFYMQDKNPDDEIATSEGIYVYAPDSGVKVGDEVNVSGEVKEWREEGYDDANDLLTTQITSSNVEVLSSDNDLPENTVIGEDRIPPTVTTEDDGRKSFDAQEDGLDFYESLEGMLVEMKDATVTSPPKYEEVAVYVNTNEDQLFTDAGGLLVSEKDYNPERILLDVDGYDVNVKVGDKLDGSVTGVVSYDYSNFKIRTTGDFPAIVDGGTNRETTDLKTVEDELNVATYNMENFSAQTSQEKVDKIAETMVSNLKQPDIIGLVEVQDNNGPTDDGTVEADESYQKLIDAIEAHGGPTYKYTDIAPADKTDGGQPGGNIRVGFIYNPERVSMPEKPSGDAATAVQVSEEGLSLNPGRIDPTNKAFYDSRKPLAAEFEFQGEKVIVVANHFNSKSGDDALFGSKHPVELGSEVQRMQQAEVVNGFVQEVVNKIERANVVVLGDLNDFEFSAPINTLEGEVLTNMIEKLPLDERYSYNYQGNSQVLDHILVSNNLAGKTEIDSVNINADFSEEDGRASDHDPMLAQIDFGTTVDRVAGTDRYKTAVEVSKLGWEKSDTVVIARGDSFPDALAGAPLAYKLDAPILLTKSHRLSSDVKAEINRLGAKYAVILGGDGAVSNYVRYQLQGEGLSVERVSGTNRFETAAHIAARLDGTPEKAVIAAGRNYPDALSTASYAAQKGYPILLTEDDELPYDTKRALSGIGETIVVGGEGAVSEEVASELPNATRYNGTNRFETSAAIASQLAGSSEDAFVSTGWEFADALTGAVLAAKKKAPMLLVEQEDIPDSIEDLIESKDYGRFHVLGGPNAVSEEVVDELRQ